YSLADSFVYMLLFFLICHRFGPTLFPYTTLFRSSRPWSRCSRRSRRGCRSTPATCSSPRHLGRPLQACPCGLLPSRFSYRHSAWRARGYVPMSDGTRRDGQACAPHPAPKTVRPAGGLGLTHPAVQQTVVDVNSGPEEPIASISPSGCSQTRSTTSRLDRGS